jgi:dienelactone hydrolase
MNESAKPPHTLNSEIPPALEKIIIKALEKDPNSRYDSMDQLITDLERFKKIKISPEQSSISLRSIIIKPQFIGIMIGLCLIAIASYWYINQKSKIKWAEEIALPEIEQIIGYAKITGLSSAYTLAVEAEQYISDNPKLKELLSKCSTTLSITSTPSVAAVYIKKYQNSENNWEYLGQTPIDSLRIARDYFIWKFEKDGFESTVHVSNKYNLKDSLNMRLIKQGLIPEKMVFVKGRDGGSGTLPDFFYDTYEVTNKEFKHFINNGGYQNTNYWKHTFVKGGRVLSWDEAMAVFVDKTGRPGPATWEAGDYPEGQDDYPVSGVSWYEAAAYAEFRQKALPTIYHWSVANGNTRFLPEVPPYLIIDQSNFSAEGSKKVGSNPGISINGAFDIAGNVREWCYNESQGGRCIRGGAWNDVSYMVYRITQAEAIDRSPKNGFRCVHYIDEDKIPPASFRPYKENRENDDYRKVAPVSDEIFQVYKESFSYDKEPVESELIYRDDSAEDWIKEKVSFRAAYNNERVQAYLYLPKHVNPPFQTVIVFPHSGATRGESSENLEYQEGIDFLIKDGRAVVYPIYKGTFERGGPEYWKLHGQVSTRKYFDLVVKLVKDFRRSIDYLETREDVDKSKLAYYSYSWGGEMISLIAAVEKRLDLAILNTGGMRGFDAGGKIYALADPINYVTRVKIPVLMLNGEYDMIYQYEKVVKPMYELLGTEDKNKLLLTYPTDHFVPRNDLIRESLKWLDRHFGSVR